MWNAAAVDWDDSSSVMSSYYIVKHTNSYFVDHPKRHNFYYFIAAIKELNSHDGKMMELLIMRCGSRDNMGHFERFVVQ